MGQKNLVGDLNVTGAIKHNGTEINYSGISEVTASDVDSGAATAGQVLAANGSGGAAWTTQYPGQFIDWTV